MAADRWVCGDTLLVQEEGDGTQTLTLTCSHGDELLETQRVKQEDSTLSFFVTSNHNDKGLEVPKE